jgi:hypothetical protein
MHLTERRRLLQPRTMRASTALRHACAVHSRSLTATARGSVVTMLCGRSHTGTRLGTYRRWAKRILRRSMLTPWARRSTIESTASADECIEDRFGQACGRWAAGDVSRNRWRGAIVKRDERATGGTSPQRSVSIPTQGDDLRCIDIAINGGRDEAPSEILMRRPTERAHGMTQRPPIGDDSRHHLSAATSTSDSVIAVS